ncbi:RRP12-like protein [Ptychodera flava]|uniref:RRP12-like protein n=1 Tax=Ptychodera flava TaxID=63121 RepID=UPI00396A4820
MARGPGRIKGGKGKRWKKGHSSSSNPQTKSHRQNAKSRFFHQTTAGGSGLTETALKRHNQAVLDDDDVEIQDVDKQTVSDRSCGTFMSGLTDCTNPTFDKVKKFWDNNSASHKEICAVLAAVTEVIRAQGGKETETEYFAALVTTLETVDTEESKAAVLYLLNMVMKRIAPSVLKSRFSMVSKPLLEILAQHSGTAVSPLLRSTLSCLATLLRVQEIAVWNDASTLQVYHGILSFSIHPKPKVRRAAHQAVCAILKGSTFMSQGDPPPYHPAASATAKFCIQQIEDTGGAGEAHATLHVLGLLKDILGVFPQSSLKSTCETILRVMTLSNVLVMSCAMQALHGMFLLKPKPSSLPADLNAQLINALYDYQPSENDVQPSLAWLAVMEKAHNNLQRVDERLCISHLPRIFSTAMKCFASEKREITQAATQTLKELLQHCVKPAAERLQNEVKSAPSGCLTSGHKMFKAVESGLAYKYHASWGLVLQVLGVFFEVLGKECPEMMKKCLQSIADLRNTHQFLYIYELDKAVGMAVRTMGPRMVLEAIPLQVTGNEDNYDFPRSWLIPVLRDNTRETELQFFIRYFLPLAAKLKTRSLELQQSGHLVESKTYDVLQSQMWSLLPGFCTNPTDLCQSFKNIARILGSVLTDRPDLRPDVCSALRLLISKNVDNEENKAEVAKYAKNFLPILFNIYTTVDAEKKDYTRFTVLETIKTYLTVTDPKLVNNFLDKAMDKLSTEVASVVKHAVMDLCIAMVTHIDSDKLNKVYRTTVVPFLQSQDKTMQKKSYRILEEICGSSSDASQKFVEDNISELQEILLNTLASSISSSKAPRLRCLTYLVKRLSSEHSNFIESITGEIILCTKEVGIKARQAAFTLLIEVGNTMVRLNPDKTKQECLGRYVETVSAGLVGSPTMVSATIVALTRLLYELRDKLPSDVLGELIDGICILLKSRNRDIVQSALGFVKVLISVLSDIALAQHLQKLIDSVVTWNSDSRHHFRFKVKSLFGRLMKKYGYETIFKMVPENYRKMLKNTQKIQERNKKRKALKEANKVSDEDENESAPTHKTKPESIEELLQDTDSEDDMDEEEKKPKKRDRVAKKQKTAAWLQEDADEEPLDFLDPAVSKRVLATNPDLESTKKKAAAKHEFKTAPDGRLIITMDDDDDEGEETSKRKKASMDDLDVLMEESAPAKGNRKRKLEEDSDEEVITKYKAGGSGIHRPVKVAKRSNLPPGAEYRAKKAGGDMKRRGMPDPYAYVPLNMKQLNKRKKAKSSGQWKSIVKAARRGAKKGIQIKGQKRKGRK